MNSYQIDRMSTLDERYKRLLAIQADTKKKIRRLTKNTCECGRCGHLMRWKDIDPLEIRREECSDWYDSWAEYYLKCDKCGFETRIDDTGGFDGILEVHGMPFSQWCEQRKHKDE